MKILAQDDGDHTIMGEQKTHTFPPQEPNFDDAAAVGLEQTAAETKRLKVQFFQEEKGLVPESPPPKSSVKKSFKSFKTPRKW